MKIKIVRARKPTFWYSKFIGQVFTVTGEKKNGRVMVYFVNNNNTQKVFMVNKSDCRLIIGEKTGKTSHNLSQAGPPNHDTTYKPCRFINTVGCESKKQSECRKNCEGYMPGTASALRSRCAKWRRYEGKV